MGSLRKLAPIAAVFCVIAGLVLSHFNGSVAPPTHLFRPLVLSAFLAVVIGACALVAGRNAVPLAAAGGALLAAPYLWGMLVASTVVSVLLLSRIRAKAWNLQFPVLVAAIVFLLSGVVQALPRIAAEWPDRVDEMSDGPPQFLVLLDAYPRIDTAAKRGIDNAPFIAELEERGFDHYSDAYTDRIWTFDVLTVMFGKDRPRNESLEEQRRVRDQWRLPPGWAMISPPASHVTIPRSEDLSQGGLTWFELDAFKRSLLARLPGIGRLVMSELRHRLASDLAVLGSTPHRHVFAHFVSPHVPFLYGPDGAPITASRYPSEELTAPGFLDVDGLEGTLDYLNGEVLQAVDRIISRYPDATVVLFSDHGGRYDLDERDEWHRIFLAARTPRPWAFADAPKPAAIMSVLAQSS